jgi:hypothetical protein
MPRIFATICLAVPAALVLAPTPASAQYYAPPVVYYAPPVAYYAPAPRYYAPPAAYRYYAPPAVYYGPPVRYYYYGNPVRRFWDRQARFNRY